MHEVENIDGLTLTDSKSSETSHLERGLDSSTLELPVARGNMQEWQFLLLPLLSACTWEFIPVNKRVVSGSFLC